MNNEMKSAGGPLSLRTGVLWGLLLTGLQSGCAANTPREVHQAKVEPYYQDAQLCRARNPARIQEPGVDPAIQLDLFGYLRCMRGMGYQQEPRTDPLIKALERCQKGSVNVTARGVTSVRPPTPKDLRECLQQRGFSSQPDRSSAE